MSSAHKSLNACVKIERLLKLLGCHARGQGLPLRTRCPICRKGQLTVFRDLQCGGGWHACNNCGSNGDLLALAARARSTSIPNVIAQLVGEGLYIPSDTASVQQYLVEHVDYDARLQQLWTTAQEAHVRPHAEFVHLTQQLGLQREAWRHNWRESIGRLIGSLSKSEVEKYFAPGVMADATARRQTGSPSAHRVFPGEHWEQVVAIRYMDLPGRIATCLFVGRQADSQRDFVIKRAHRGPQGNQHIQTDAEAGVAYPPDVYDAADAFNRTVIGIGDPLLTLRLQVRHLRDHQRSLPLINWYDSDAWPHWYTGGRRTRTQRAWQQFAGYRVVLWAPLGLDVLVLRQAIAADAWISTAGPQFRTDEQLQEYAWKRRPDELCRHIIETARPWNEVLSKELEKRGSSQMLQWTVQLEHESESVETVVSRLRPRIREQMQEALAAAQSPRTIELDGQTILEANGCWQLLRQGRPPTLILNAIFRIDRALYDKERERGHVRGRILVNDHVISFSEPLSVVEEDTAGYLARTVSQMGLGFLQYDQRFASKLIRIATHFQEPQRLDAVSRVGWDADSVRMVFPKFAIRFGGEVQDVSDTLIPDFAPALELQPPTEFGPLPQDLDPARDNAEAGRLFWAMLACVASNLLAPTFYMNTTGICLEGRGARAVGLAVADALGCQRVPVRNARDVQHALVAEKTHGMPLVFDVGPGLQRKHLQQLLAGDSGERNCIVTADWHTSRLLSVATDWHVITSDERMPIPPEVMSSAALALPSYLRVHFSRRVDVVNDMDDSPTLVERLLPDLVRFVHEGHGNTRSVRGAREVLLPDCPETSIHALIDLLGRLVAEGRIKLAPTADGRGKPTIVEVREQDLLLLPYDALEDAVRKHPVELPGPWHIARLLHERNLMADVPENTFALRRSWVLAQWRKSMQLRGKLLKVCG